MSRPKRATYAIYSAKPWEPSYLHGYTHDEKWAKWYCNEMNSRVNIYETYYVIEKEIQILKSDYTPIVFEFTFDTDSSELFQSDVFEGEWDNSEDDHYYRVIGVGVTYAQQERYARAIFAEWKKTHGLE